MRIRLLAFVATGLALGACTDMEPISEPAVQFSLAQGVYDCSAQTQIPERECEALVALYNSTNGPDWTGNHNWLETDYPCGWAGVMCTATDPYAEYPPPGIVVSLSLSGLTGTLPPEIGNLTNLESLYMSHNKLTGPIPAELGNLENAWFIQLDHNQLTGPIPPGLSFLYLDLQFNQLSGPIPPDLAAQYLLLNNNQLTSPVPPEPFADAYSVDLRWNRLSGLLPIEVAVREPPDCRLAEGNPDLYMPDTWEYRIMDWDHDGYVCGLSYTSDPSVVAADIATILDGLVATGILNGGRANALGNRIDSAMKHLDKGRNAQAVTHLQNFIEQVENLTGAVLAGVQADELILRANILIELVSR